MDKKCNKCNEVKSLEFFGKDRSTKDGLMYRCKVCSSAAASAWRAANPDKEKARKKAYREANRDKVNAKNKAWAEANPEKTSAYKKSWRDANPDKEKASKKAYVETNPEKVKASKKAYREANRDKVKAVTKSWQLANSDRVAATAGRGCAIKRGGSVSSIYNIELCIPFYVEARRLTRETGIKHDVDHIVPIVKGGLHCQTNLQVLTAYENRSKGDTV